MKNNRQADNTEKVGYSWEGQLFEKSQSHENKVKKYQERLLVEDQVRIFKCELVATSLTDW